MPPALLFGNQSSSELARSEDPQSVSLQYPHLLTPQANVAGKMPAFGPGALHPFGDASVVESMGGSVSWSMSAAATPGTVQSQALAAYNAERKRLAAAMASRKEAGNPLEQGEGKEHGPLALSMSATAGDAAASETAEPVNVSATAAPSALPQRVASPELDGGDRTIVVAMDSFGAPGRVWDSDEEESEEVDEDEDE